MDNRDSNVSIPDEVVVNKIYLIRDQKVMLDRDLAELYGVETKVLKQQVRRNIDGFPCDFMFELTEEEFKSLRSHFVTSNRGGTRYRPMAFTEHGVLMLSSVLKTKRARQVNIHIMRVYNKLREILLTNKDLLIEMEEIRRKVAGQDEKIQMIFKYLKQFIKEQEKPKTPIGFKQNHT
jgi:hypothetical protein